MPQPVDTLLLPRPHRPARPSMRPIPPALDRPAPTPPVARRPDRLRPGDRVEVQNRFDGRWSRGFEVVDVLHGVGTRHYRIRRLSDGAVLPRLFVEDEVDPAR